MKKRRVQVSMVAATAFALLTGCIFQPEPRVVQGEPYPAPGAKPQQEHRDSGSVKAEASPSATALDVTLSQPTECRDQTPMVRDVTTERKANVMEQYINGGSAVGLGALGLGVMLAPCTTTPSGTSSNPNPPSQPCTSDEQNSRKVTGGVIIGVGALFGVAFLYNVIRAHDSKETVPVHVEPQWKSCETHPVTSTPLHLDLADGQQLVQTTNGQGQAHFDLTAVRWTDDALKAGQARVATGGQQLASVNLTSLPQYADWKRRQQQQQIGDALAEVEQGLAELRSPRWTYEQADRFEQVKGRTNQIAAGKDKLGPVEQARVASVQRQVEELASSHSQEIAVAAQARAEAARERQAAAALQEGHAQCRALSMRCNDCQAICWWKMTHSPCYNKASEATACMDATKQCMDRCN